MLHFGQNVVHKVPAASKVTSVALGQDVKANSFRALGALFRNLTSLQSSVLRKHICLSLSFFESTSQFFVFVHGPVPTNGQ